MAGQPKASFYVVLAAVILGLLGFAAWRMELFGPGGNGEGGGSSVTGDGDVKLKPGDMVVVEDETAAGILTVNEYSIVPQESLTPVTGASAYKPMEDNTVKFALNVWAGWAPIIYANEGAAAGKVWQTADGKEFKVQLVLIDDPTTMLDTYVTGDVHIGWATLDMLPLFMERLLDNTGAPVDSRVMPRVYQQVDWSNGGDGIVVRDSINNVKDLRGKQIALAQNSPSHYFLLNMLVAGGVQPRDVTMKFTGDAFEAAALYASNKDIAACVSWAPDIYKLADTAGSKMLVDTTTANRLIADVWFARADYAKDHPEIIEGLARGIFDAMDDLKDNQANQTKAAKFMADVYSIPAEETQGMFADAHSTRWGDNYQFFVNQNYLANFERVWNNAYYLYGQTRIVKKPKVDFSKVMDYTVIKKLGEEDKYKSQTVAAVSFAPRTISASEADQAVLTTTHYIHFYPNSADINKKVFRKNSDGQDVEEAYDPNVDFVLERIGEQIGQFERSRIVIEGHTDSSMRGQVDEGLVLELSQDRADSVLGALTAKFEQLDKNRFQANGVGWRRPAEADRPNDHAKNRRVEVRILPAEGALRLSSSDRDETRAQGQAARGSISTSAERVNRSVGRLRSPISLVTAAGYSTGCLLLVLAVWWILTRGGSAESRLVSPLILPSPAETFGELGTMFKERNLDVNTLVSLRRVVLGFILATVVGVPVGILCGCFTRVAAFFAPITLFGRNIPMAALIPLTFMFFGTGEGQKIIFIFIAAVAFIISDSAQAVRDVAVKYIDTAYTLGASRRQTIMKVLVPLALPTIFNSLRLLFGLAFGYIMLAEVVQIGEEAGGLGQIINISRRRGMVSHILIVLMLIPLVALAIDRVLLWVQALLFPHRYGGGGYLANLAAFRRNL